MSDSPRRIKSGLTHLARNDTESRLVELQGRNDELSYELAQKKKEEKDAKINHNSQALLLARVSPTLT